MIEKNNSSRPTPQRRPDSMGRTRIGGNITAGKRPSSDETRVSSNITVGRSGKTVQKTSSQKKPDAPLNKKIEMTKNTFKSTVKKALIYIAVVVLISTVLSILGIKWANDLFALVKEENLATIYVPEGATIAEVSDILGKNGVIEYPFLFRFYVGFKYRDYNNGEGITFKEGEHEVKSTLNYDQLVSMIRHRDTREVIKITIPEGYTVDEIIDLFTSKKMGTRAEFVDAINNYPFEYTFMNYLNEIELSPNRRYRLEGYLFPDTYEFYTDASEVSIVDKMLANFNTKFEEVYYARIKELGLNIDQLVTLASMVQMEAKFNTELYTISGVFHNRLKSSQFTKFESCATIQYILAERKEFISDAETKIDNPYNTYFYEGFPPSSICNPGIDAINAALYPEDHKYYYFVADVDGNSLFATSYTQHLSNKAQAERNRAERAKQSQQQQQMN